MLLTNLSCDLVNGLQGHVVKLHEDSCKVKFENGSSVDIEPYTFTIYSKEKNYNVAS